MMTCKEDFCFNLVESSRTEELPDGDARLAWEELKIKYEPSNTMSMIVVKKEFALCELTDSGQDPNVWIRYLQRMRQRLATMGHQVSDIYLIIHIINNLMANLEREIDSAVMDLERLKNRLRTKYRRLMEKDSKPEKRGIKVDKLLFSKESLGFKGTCQNCGKYGHKQ
jgi:hypothetical protein